jgi:hypothetical protein
MADGSHVRTQLAYNFDKETESNCSEEPKKKKK